MAEDKKMKELREKLLSGKKNGYDKFDVKEEKTLESYCTDYKAFLDASKTERECAAELVRLAEKAGFKPFARGMGALICRGRFSGAVSVSAAVAAARLGCGAGAGNAGAYSAGTDAVSGGFDLHCAVRGTWVQLGVYPVCPVSGGGAGGNRFGGTNHEIICAFSINNRL